MERSQGKARRVVDLRLKGLIRLARTIAKDHSEKAYAYFGDGG